MKGQRFTEKFKIGCDLISTGSTIVLYTPFYDMLGVKRLDAIISGIQFAVGPGAVGGTLAQTYTAAIYQASNSTGGGATKIATAGLTMGKSGTAAISTASKLRTLRIGFATMSASGGASIINIGINGSSFTAATGGYIGDGTAGTFKFNGNASAQATVAMESFVAAFNSTVQNTNTSLTDNFEASTKAGAAECVIRPKNPDGTLILSATVNGGALSSVVWLGGDFNGHIGIDRKHIAAGKRYVAVGVKAVKKGAFGVTVIRELEQGQQPSINMLSQDITSDTAWSASS